MSVKSRGFLFVLFSTMIGCANVKGSGTQLPIQIINGLPYVEAKVNGQGPYLFGFDSGFGGELELDSSLSVKLGLHPTGQMEMGDPSGRNSRILSTTTINELELGDLKFNVANAILRNRRAMPGMEKVAGILGISLFKDYLLTIDFPGKKFIIEDGNLEKPNGKDIFDYVISGGGVPGIPIKVGNTALTAFLDTRAMSSYFILPASLVEKLELLTEPRPVGKARTVSNEITINEVQIKDTIFIGNNAYPVPVIVYPSLNNSGTIGSNALQEYSISFDQKNKLLRLVRTRSENKKNDKEVSVSQELQEYTGQYGERKISLDADGSLFIQRPGGMELKMIAKKKDEFSLERIPAAMIVFERDDAGKIMAIKLLNQEGNWERVPKIKQ